MSHHQALRAPGHRGPQNPPRPYLKYRASRSHLRWWRKQYLTCIEWCLEICRREWLRLFADDGSGFPFYRLPLVQKNSHGPLPRPVGHLRPLCRTFAKTCWPCSGKRIHDNVGNDAACFHYSGRWRLWRVLRYRRTGHRILSESQAERYQDIRRPRLCPQTEIRRPESGVIFRPSSVIFQLFSETTALYVQEPGYPYSDLPFRDALEVILLIPPKDSKEYYFVWGG